MKMPTLLTLSVLALLVALPLRLSAQSFDAGSDGSYGAINITANTTLTTPADGVFHCTTITIASGTVLKFTRNALNTPIYLLATGDVTVLGTIDVSATAPRDGTGATVGGTGGPGGFDGGATGYFSGSASRAAGSGQGPGGGIRGSTTTAGSGSYRTVNAAGRANNGAAYGNALLMPLIGGSGGGGADAANGGYGSGGGGAILLASNTKITHWGNIFAMGGPASYGNGGSGGAIRLVAPRVFGNGGLHAYSSYYGGDGRIRVDSLFKIEPTDTTQFLAFNFVPAAAATVGSTLIAFPPQSPTLDILKAADIVIPEGTPAPVVILLPLGSSPNRTVTVEARNFNDVIDVTVKLIPESGDVSYIVERLDNRITNPISATLNVVIPTNVKVNIQAWATGLGTPL